MRLRTASGLAATLGLAMASFLTASPASAQVSGCESLQKLLTARQSLVAKITSAQKAKRKMTPQEACSTFGTLVNNGNETLKFATANQDWCQIPASFIDGLKADNQKITTFRGQACNAVKQQAAMQRRAQQQQQAQGANPFGGADSITSGAGGGLKVPQGAL